MSKSTAGPNGQVPLPDKASRDVIERNLDVNMLVEAGAGSGKTQSLATRMAAGVLSGQYRVEHMAAVTFTRKAAAELRGRFQQVLEKRRASEDDPDRRQRAQEALSRLERLFVGTIHSFCAHLLRERPVEAGLAPGFAELDDVGAIESRQQLWRAFIARKRAEGGALLPELRDAGIRAGDLDHAFATICTFDEVEFPAGDAPAPDPTAAWAALDRFWQQLDPLLPRRIPDDTTCKVLQKARDGQWKIRIARRDHPADLVDLVAPWEGAFRITMSRWTEWHEDPRQLREDIDRMLADLRAAIGPFLEAWRHYVYRLAITLMVQGRAFARAHRYRALTLEYEDLLQCAARVLRENRTVRRALQQKYQWLFVDEFQDTDPIQAEVVTWLASDGRDASDWTTVSLRPGALFIVGDPKQSIYRFRRADIEIYSRVNELIHQSGGSLVPLAANFRATPLLCEWANGVFKDVFPDGPTLQQPQYQRLEPAPSFDTNQPPSPSGRTTGIRVLTTPSTCQKAADVVAHDAGAIARYIRAEIDAGNRQPGDFLVLTWKKGNLAEYARAMDAERVPVEVSGASAFGDSEQVHVLAALLRALADPDDEVEVVGVLRGPLFGVSDPALYAHRSAGGTFIFTGVPLEDGPTTPAESSVIRALSRLRAMYHITRTLSAPAAVERILEDTGFLALTVGETPGGAKAGDLLQALDRVRWVTEEGGTLADAAASLEADVESNDVESLPFEPGRTDVVRLMNLHKAKGLQAEVVFLADPCGAFLPKADRRIVRDGESALGVLRIERKKPGSVRGQLLGLPVGWDAHETAELAFVAAEHERLRYVAATRARTLLVVSRWGKPNVRKGPWLPFDPHLAGMAELQVPTEVSEPTLVSVDLSPKAIEKADYARVRRFLKGAELSFTIESVTGATHRDVVVREEDSAQLLRGPATGIEWGDLVHKLLECAATTGQPDRERLRRRATWLTRGKPALQSVITATLDTVEQVMTSDMWQRALHADERYTEVPFSYSIEAKSGQTKITHGVIDLAYRRGNTWEIVDYKTDQVDDPAELTARYHQQLTAYARAWKTLRADESRVRVGLHAVRLNSTEWRGAV